MNVYCTVTRKCTHHNVITLLTTHVIPWTFNGLSSLGTSLQENKTSLGRLIKHLALPNEISSKWLFTYNIENNISVPPSQRQHTSFCLDKGLSLKISPFNDLYQCVWYQILVEDNHDSTSCCGLAYTTPYLLTTDYTKNHQKQTFRKSHLGESLVLLHEVWDIWNIRYNNLL